MVSSNLEQYNVADFLQWHNDNLLVLNPYFQRNRVWSPAAKSYLIDTILLRLPVPKIFLRSKIDLKTKRSVREVVDGQQRLSAIIDFANGKLRLTSRSKKYSGFTYNDLSDEEKQAFLSYGMAVDNLINATDGDVLSIFSRLNSYGVKLNAAEKRHADYQGEFKWTAYALADELGPIWEKYGVLSVAQRTRMLDHSLVSECLGILLQGVEDGGENRINKLYAKYDKEIPNKDLIVDNFRRVVDFMDRELGGVLIGPVSRAPHFLMLFAASAHACCGIPRGAIAAEQFPPARRLAGDLDDARAGVVELSNAIEDDDPPRRLEAFVQASSASTQRISSRRVRFPLYCQALAGLPV